MSLAGAASPEPEGTDGPRTGRGVEPDPTDDWTLPPPAGEPSLPAVRAGLPAVRPGPDLLDADSWADVTALVTYAGRRRAEPRRRLWIVISLVLFGLGAVVAIPLALVAAGGDRAGSAGSPPPATGADVGDHTLTAGEASLVPATGAAAGTTNVARTTAGRRPTAAATTVTKAAIAAFAPVTLEAEGPGVTLSGSAWISSYPGASNGSIVRNLGLWDNDPGSLQFTNVSIPTDGAYVITIYFVHLDGELTRTAQIAVSGATTITQTFTGSATCCASMALPAITLTAGTHTITFGNSTGHAPSVDKIVISRP